MTHRLVTAIYWLVLSANALVWLIALWYPPAHPEGWAATILAGIVPFAVLPVIRWVRTGEWHVDPR